MVPFAAITGMRTQAAAQSIRRQQNIPFPGKIFMTEPPDTEGLPFHEKYIFVSAGTSGTFHAVSR
jgi:hypothetical protein